MAGQYPEMDLPAGTFIVGVLPGFADTRNGQKQVFDVQCNNGQSYRTFSPQAGAQAQQYVNNPNVTIRISVNGQYQNFSSVYPSGQAPPIQQGMAQGAPMQQQPPVAGQPQFTPAPGFVDAKLVEMRRVGGVQNATAALGPLVGSGYYIDGDTLNLEHLTADIISLAGSLARYTVFGPQGEQAATPETQEPAPALPPGVTAEQVQAWAAANGGDVTVGAPTAEAAPSESY